MSEKEIYTLHDRLLVIQKAERFDIDILTNIVNVYSLCLMNKNIDFYIISMVGSILLIGLYIASHTVGLPLIGLEHVGFLDLLTAALQGGIVAVSAYVMILSSSKTITTTTHTS